MCCLLSDKLIENQESKDGEKKKGAGKDELIWDQKTGGAKKLKAVVKRNHLPFFMQKQHTKSTCPPGQPAALESNLKTFVPVCVQI